jgi:hypothetical protein
VFSTCTPTTRPGPARSATCCTRAHTIVEAAKASGVEGLDPALLADFSRNPDPLRSENVPNGKKGTILCRGRL